MKTTQPARAGFEDGERGAMSQGMWAASKSRKGQRRGFSARASKKEDSSADTLTLDQ